MYWPSERHRRVNPDAPIKFAPVRLEHTEIIQNLLDRCHEKGQDVPRKEILKIVDDVDKSKDLHFEIKGSVAYLRAYSKFWDLLNSFEEWPDFFHQMLEPNIPLTLSSNHVPYS